MRHNQRRHQLNRFTSWRKASLKSLVRNLVIHQRIRTTFGKAKACQSLAENLVSLAKQDNLSARRRAFRILGEHNLVSRLFKEIGPLFAHRVSGFTRILNLSSRRGDGARIVFLELTEKKLIPKKPKKEKAVKEEPPEKPVEAEEIKQMPKPPIEEKPRKKFLGGIRKIFKKERDSL